MKVEIEKVNQLSTNIRTGNITEVKKLIYDGSKLVCDKIGVPLRETNKNTKLAWEIRLEGQVKKSVTKSESTKEGKHARVYNDEQNNRLVGQYKSKK